MNRRLIALAIAVTAAIIPTGAISQGRIIEMGITSSGMAQFFQSHAGSSDIARVDHPNDIGLIANITVGRKMVIFKSASQIEQFLATSANGLDIVGYNLEPGQANDPAELADPVEAAKRVRAIAQQYGKAVAVGLTHDLTLQYGAQMAPYADIWVLQIQRVQNDPAMVGEFVGQMVPALRKANPNIAVFVQIRTDSQPEALVSLVNGLGDVNVSILTQKQDVQDAINVAGAFFGNSGSQQQSLQTNFKPVAMPGGSEYGIRIPAKIQGWYAPTASNLIGSDERDHLKRGSINAWDWSTAYGSPVFAIGPGTVRYAGCNDAGHYGCWVSIGHGNGLQSDYAHCATNSIRVQAGQQVDASTQLCNVGNTGWTDWAHTHLAIKLNGSPQPIENYFDKGLIVHCFWTQCKATNDPNAPIAGLGGTTQQQPAPAIAENGLTQLLRTLAQMPAEQLSSAIFMLTLAIGMALWLGGLWIRIVIVSASSAMVGALVIAVMLMPVAPVQTTTQQAPVAGGDWEKAYQIVQGNEGWDCTNDGAYTMGGVTQGTYNRWRRLHGMGNADVCASLTREEAKLVFRDLFWIPSGADKMQFPLALTVVDHYYNTGAVKHLLSQCGTDVACFNQARIADYKTKGNCNLYCVAWINRVNKIRKYTGG